MRNRKIILIIIGAIIGIILLWVSIVMVIIKNEYKYFNTVKTGQLTSDLYAINDDFVNVFILEKNDKYLAIDSGNTKKNIEKIVKRLNFTIYQCNTISCK